MMVSGKPLFRFIHPRWGPFFLILDTTIYNFTKKVSIAVFSL